MTRWKDYEALASRIYEQLGPQARVVHDDHIRGWDSGIERQIDVSTRTSVAGHSLLVVVQAKDLAAPADVNVVGEFLTVVKDVRASKGVLICNAGFTPAARTLASTHSIDLCSLHDAQSKDWPLALEIPLLWIEYSCTVLLDMRLAPDRTNPTDITYPPDPMRWRFSRDEGRTLLKNPFREFARKWNAEELPRGLGTTHRYAWDASGVRFGFDPDFWCPVADFVLHYDVVRKAWLGCFKLRGCIGIMNESTQILTARITIRSADLPVTRDPTWAEVEDPDKLERESPNLILTAGEGERELLMGR